MTPELMRKCVAELIGTFFLCFIGAGAILVDDHAKPTVQIPAVSGAERPALLQQPALGLVGIALAHGLALSIAVTATMNISGAHINPAVTVSMWVCKRIPGHAALGYIAAQLVGGSLAGLALAIIYGMIGGGGGSDAIQHTHLGTPFLGEGVGFLLGVFVEIILTFLLVFSIFGTAVDPRAPKVGGFGIGLTVTFDILMGGPLTGASMNPARTFGTALPIGYFPMPEHLVYWIGPIIGGVLAGLLYTAFLLPASESSASGR